MLAERVPASFDNLDWQDAPWCDTSFVLLLTGSAGGGKSRLAAEKLHGFCLAYPGAQALLLRKTRESLGNGTLVFLEKQVIGDDSRVHHAVTNRRFEYANGSMLAYGGMADDDQREQIRSIGQAGGVDIVWMEEANAFDEDDFDEVTARMRGRAAPWRQIILTTNPDAPSHWIATRLIRDKGASVHYSRADDNPHNPDDYRQTLQGMKGTLKKRLADGLWVAAEGMYFEEWDEDVHVVPAFPIPDYWPRWIAVDYGFAAPFCCLWFARDPETRAVYVEGEAYRAGLHDHQQARAIVDRLDPALLSLAVGDPSMFNERKEQGRSSIASVYQTAGIPLVPGINNRKQGWATVRRYLAHGNGVGPLLRVMRDRAPNLVRTLPSLVRDPLDPEDVADKVNGRAAEDHAADPLRYGLVAVDPGFVPDEAPPTEYAFGPDPADSVDAEQRDWLSAGKVNPFDGRDDGEA